jgi:hypothetical protein
MKLSLLLSLALALALASFSNAAEESGIEIEPEKCLELEEGDVPKSSCTPNEMVGKVFEPTKSDPHEVPPILSAENNTGLVFGICAKALSAWSRFKGTDTYVWAGSFLRVNFPKLYGYIVFVLGGISKLLYISRPAIDTYKQDPSQSLLTLLKESLKYKWGNNTVAGMIFESITNSTAQSKVQNEGQDEVQNSGLWNSLLLWLLPKLYYYFQTA